MDDEPYNDMCEFDAVYPTLRDGWHDCTGATLLPYIRGVADDRGLTVVDVSQACDRAVNRRRYEVEDTDWWTAHTWPNPVVRLSFVVLVEGGGEYFERASLRITGEKGPGTHRQLDTIDIEEFGLWLQGNEYSDRDKRTAHDRAAKEG
jgi:hypothetical protein